MNIRCINPDALDVATLNFGCCRVPELSCALGAFVDDQDRFSDLVTQVFKLQVNFRKGEF